jgi:hypothetical protein
MTWLGEPWYAALLTAAAYHGAGEAPEGEFQVMTTWTRPAITCAGWRVVFFGRANAADVPVVEKVTTWGAIPVSSVEATAVDLVGYGVRVDGALSDPVRRTLTGLMDTARLASLEGLSPRAWMSRLGFHRRTDDME